LYTLVKLPVRSPAVRGWKQCQVRRSATTRKKPSKVLVGEALLGKGQESNKLTLPIGHIGRLLNRKPLFNFPYAGIDASSDVTLTPGPLWASPGHIDSNVNGIRERA
jgi:hypothetical protein